VEVSDTKQLQAWVANWKSVAPELERLRIEKIRNANTQQAIRLFDLAFKLPSAIRLLERRLDSSSFNARYGN